MEIPKRKEPKNKDLNHISTNWYKEKGKLTRVSVYNKKEEVPKEPKGDGPLTNEQFNKLMGRFDGLETDLKAEIKSVKDDVQSVKDDVQSVKDDVQKLTAIVKKNHPDDF